MAAKWCDEGENRVADILFGEQAVDTYLYIGLYKNQTEPSESARISDLTEVVGTGYERKRLDRGSWVILESSATYAEQTFLSTGGDWGYVYGYFICTTLDASGKLLAIEHFTTPFYIEGGKGIKITPKIQID